MTTATFTLVMVLPLPDGTRSWPGKLMEAVPGIEVLCPEGPEDVGAALGRADAAYGTRLFAAVRRR